MTAGTESAGVKSVRLFITGRVQGVGYRHWCVRQAGRLGLEGWVRNRLDGSVEAVAHGPAAAVDRFTQACRQGPRGAAVDGVYVADADALAAGMPGFRQEPTA